MSALSPSTSTALAEARYVSFAGAGTRGILYVGLLEALEDALGEAHEEWRAALRGAAGTSAGACAALLLLLGLDRAARRETLRELSDMRAIVRCPDVGLLLRHYGWEDGRAFKELVQRLLVRGGLSGESTLGDLKRLLRQEFVCVCTDLRTGRALELSAKTHPTLRVCDAVYASCCVPFVFAPARVPGVDGAETLATDGCLTCNLPDVFDEAQTLYVTLGESPSEGVHSWSDFLHGIVRCSVAAQDHRVAALRAARPHQCLRLWLPPALCGTPAFDPTLDARGADLLFRAGYAGARDALAAGALSAAAERAVRAYATLAALPELTEEPPDDEGASAGDPGSS